MSPLIWFQVRVTIYQMLPYNDLLNIRLVSKKSKEEVEEHVDFHLKFDQYNTSRLKRLLSLRVKSCHVVHFTSRKLFRSPKIFTHPSHLKKLTFDGIISSVNLSRILKQASSLEQLHLTHQTLGIEGLVDARFPKILQKLNSLSHLNLQLLRYPQGDPHETEENVEVFLRSTFPHLYSFHLYYSLWGNFSTLLSFLQRHSPTLRELELQIGDRGDSHNTKTYLRTTPFQINSTLRKSLLSLKLTKFRFRDDVLNLNPAATELITGILLNQRSLNVIHFHSPGELSWTNLTSVIANNKNSLTEVVVYNVQCGGRLPTNELTLDMSIFSQCSHLKTLALSCASSNGNDPNVVGAVVMRMTNLNNISPSVERLHLTGFTLDGDELMKLANSKSASLKEVLIADAGAMRYSDVITAFLTKCGHLSYLNVRPVVLQAANEELWWKEVGKLTKLYERFMGIQFDPIDDLEGFEANIKPEDREWLKSSHT